MITVEKYCFIFLRSSTVYDESNKAENLRLFTLTNGRYGNETGAGETVIQQYGAIRYYSTAALRRRQQYENAVSIYNNKRASV
uniref:Uncharacterized protein n=1 Tax=Romanomermis culicivorax TaxID=13658 RepID=A0A915I9U9_ROMCU